jgi:Threonyl-tRNA synthetase
MSLPERFDLTYIEPNNERKRPIMIHRVIYGSIERFLGILVEHYAGKFPLWMAPVQVILMSLNDELIPFTKTIQDLIKGVKKIPENSIVFFLHFVKDTQKKSILTGTYYQHFSALSESTIIHIVVLPQSQWNTG